MNMNANFTSLVWEGLLVTGVKDVSNRHETILSGNEQLANVVVSKAKSNQSTKSQKDFQLQVHKSLHPQIITAYKRIIWFVFEFEWYGNILIW